MASAASKLNDNEFTQPEPEPLMPEKGAQKAYPAGCMGSVLYGAVRGISKLAFVPESLAAQSVMAACSLAVQAHFNVILPTGQTRPSSLFLVSVAESGDRKSTSDDMAMRAIHEFEGELIKEHISLAEQASMEQMAWDEVKRHTTNKHKSQGKDALEQAYRDLGSRPESPLEPTLIVRTGTTQGLLKRFMTTRPSLGLMSDEGGSWLGGYGMSEDNRLQTISTLSDFWDGKNIQMLTSGEGFTALRHKRLTFHIMVQPIVADRLLGDPEALGQGFLSRLLVSHPESLAGTRFVNPEDLHDPDSHSRVDEFQSRLAAIVSAELPIDPDTLCLQPTALRLDEKATRLWWDFYNTIEARLGPDGDLQLVKGFVGKLPEMAARMAAVLTGFQEGKAAQSIGAVTMQNAIEIAQFYLSEALRLFGQTHAPKDTSDAQLLSDWLRDKWSENLVSAAAISRSGPSIFRSCTDQIKKLLEVLERHHHITQVPNGGMVSGKKVKTAWRVHVGRN